MSREKREGSSYADALSYLNNLTSRGIRTDLSFMNRALEIAGNPQNKIPVVLVGGTNGKGSTTTMIGEIIRHARYSVGCYYSPHILDVRERITADGRMISPDVFSSLVHEVRRLIEGKVELTYFEFLTLSAYFYFAKSGFDLAIMEVGMGGRFDATNVTDCLVSIITSIDLDHTQYLGETREEIAREKVEIAHGGGTLVVGNVNDDVKRVLGEYAHTKDVRILFFGDDFTATSLGKVVQGGDGSLRYRGIGMSLDDITISLPGEHQIQNAAVALAAVEVLNGRGFITPEKTIRRALQEVRLPGRIQKIREKPEMFVDVAHNPAGARVLAEWIADQPKKKTVVVVGMMADKDIGGFTKEIERTAGLMILAPPKVERAASLAVLLEAASPVHIPVRGCATVSEALAEAMKIAGIDGRILVTGSFYTVQEAMESVLE